MQNIEIRPGGRQATRRGVPTAPKSRGNSGICLNNRHDRAGHTASNQREPLSLHQQQAPWAEINLHLSYLQATSKNTCKGSLHSNFILTPWSPPAIRSHSKESYENQQPNMTEDYNIRQQHNPRRTQIGQKPKKTHIDLTHNNEA